MSFAFVIRKTAAEFAAENTVLEKNQLGVVTDAGNATKVGDGESNWNDLGYITAVAQTPASGAAAGVEGTIAYDDSYIYVYSGGAWRRGAHATW